MNLRILKNLTRNNFVYPKVFRGKTLNFNAKATKSFDLDVEEEKAIYDFWIRTVGVGAASQPWIQDYTNHYPTLIKKLEAEKKQKIIDAKIKENPTIQKLDTEISEVEKLIAKIKISTK